MALHRPELVAAAYARLVTSADASHRQDRDAAAEDLGHRVDFLAAALYVEDATVFTDFVIWTAQVLAARRGSTRALHIGLDTLRETLHDFARASEVLDAGAAALTGG